MKHKTTQVLYAYWNMVRNGRLAPRRFDIEPARIGSILPDTFILERLADGTYRFRLAGTRIAERFGDGMRGSNFLDNWEPGDPEALVRILADVTEKACVRLLAIEASTTDGRTIEIELLLLPLVHTQGTIDRVLGSIAAIEDIPFDSSGTVASKKLLESELIWPDGHPHAALQAAAPADLFMPHVRNARIVRQDRRQFRVYDGGLDKPAGDKL
jgi:hypothetical protein